MSTFGTIISDARKRAGLSQKELATRIKKEDGQSISPQYLNDIEHDRRNPSGGFLIEQFAKALKLPKEYLILAAGAFPEEDLGKISRAKPDKVAEAYKAFRKKIHGQ